ncbi:MAG: large repetitive protein [Actinomycetota bacterium]|nr:large repetitive protein [Actinomycetota bacterium]
MKRSSPFLIVIALLVIFAQAPASIATTGRRAGWARATAQDPGAGYSVAQFPIITSGGGNGQGPPPDYPSGSTQVGTQCDDCTTPISFPFPVKFYGETYTSASAGANGNLQFTGNTLSYSSVCLPNPDFGATIFAYGADVTTFGTGNGIFTATTGSAPNRIFVIDWKAQTTNGTSQVDFKIWFDESGSFRTTGGNGSQGAAAVFGVQASGTGPFTQFSCHTSGPDAGNELRYRPLRTLTVSKTGAGSGPVTSSPTGIDCGSTCAHQFDELSQVTLTAQAASGSLFTGWSGAGCGGTETCVVTPSESKTVTADFAIARTLTVSETGSGTGTVISSPPGIDCGATCSAQFVDGTSITLTPQPGADSRFTGWSGACTGTGECTFPISQDESVSASFEPAACPGFENDPRPQFVGTAAADVLVGTSKAEIFCGSGEDDDISGKGGNDLLLGGEGDDQLMGGGGDDIVKGGGGNDWMSGAAGRDKLKGGNGKDVANGGRNRDICRAEIKKTCEA